MGIPTKAELVSSVIDSIFASDLAAFATPDIVIQVCESNHRALRAQYGVSMDEYDPALTARMVDAAFAARNK